MNILPLKVKNLNYIVNGKNILKNINIECNNNNVTIVAGNNGSGKSTFLKILHGLIKTHNNKIKWGEFYISDITPGSALSSITSYDQNGKPINEMHSFNTFSTSSDDLINLYNLPQPDYIKIDVDGVEHLILKGAMKILKNTKSILLETNFNFEDQYLAIDRILKENGFLLHSKFFFNGSTQCNAIWNKV